MDFSEPKLDQCVHCKKRKGEHQAKTMFCPNTEFMKHRTMGWTSFIKDQVYQAKEPIVCSHCGKRKTWHEKNTNHCPLGSYNYGHKGYIAFHPINKYHRKKKWTMNG